MFGHVSAVKLAAYVDQELPEDEARAIKEHLQKCSTCYEKAMSQQRIAFMARQWAQQGEPAVPSTRSTLKYMHQKLHQPESRQRRGGWQLVMVLLAIFALAYGMQSLVADIMVARGSLQGNPRLVTYVEDHLSFESSYRAAEAAP